MMDFQYLSIKTLAMFLFEEMNNTPPKENKSKGKPTPEKETLDPKKIAKLKDIGKAFVNRSVDFESLVAEEPSVYKSELTAQNKPESPVAEKLAPFVSASPVQTKDEIAIKPSANGKKIAKIVVLYTDNTFEEYNSGGFQ